MVEAAEGVHAVVRNRDLALLIGLTAAQHSPRGAVVHCGGRHRSAGIGEPGVGTLTAAVGAGAVVGSLLASLLVATRRLAGWFAIGIAMWGLPVALIGVFPSEAAALGLLACVGVANTLVDFGLQTLMARLPRTRCSRESPVSWRASSPSPLASGRSLHRL